jgi:hypothetical protein
MKNLSRMANANTKALSNKKTEEKPMAPTKGLLNRSVPDKIESKEHISIQLREMVRKAMA